MKINIKPVSQLVSLFRSPVRQAARFRAFPLVFALTVLLMPAPARAQQAPSVPTGLSAVAGNAAVALSWNSSTGATSYNVERSTTSGQEATITNVSGTNYVDTGLTDGTTYYYEVSAVNTNGQSGNSSEVSAAPLQALLVVNFDAAGGAGGFNYSGQAGFLDPGHNYWNPIVRNGTTGAGTNSDGATPSTVTLTDTSPSDYNSGQGAQGTVAGFMSPWLLNSDDSITSDTLNNVPAGTYILYLYGKNGETYASNGSTFGVSVGGTSYGSLSTLNTVTSVFTEGNDYVVFSNVVVGASGTITFTYTANTAVTTEGDFNGVQLVQVSGTPEVPFAPTGFSAVAGISQVSLSWNASSGATSYNVKRSTTSGGEVTIINVSGTSYTDTTVINGTTYYYEVSAVNAVGQSGNSPEVSATPNVPPAVPTGLSAVAGNAQVGLSWDSVSGATSYNVERSTTSGQEVTITNVSETSYVDTGVTNGTTYYYEVAAVNAGGESGNSSEVSVTPSATAPPLAPTGLSAVAGNAAVALSWNSSTGATSYNVERSTTSGQEVTIANVSGTTYTNTGLTDGTTYYYEVSAVNANGPGGNSSEVSATPVGILVVNFDVAGGVVGGVNYRGQAGFFDPGNNYWNPVVHNGTTSAGKNSDDVTTNAVTLTDTSPSDYNSGQGSLGTVAGFMSPWELNSDDSITTNTLYNVPAGTYILYLYGKNGEAYASNGSIFNVMANGISYGPLSTLNTVTSVFTEGNDYVVFSNVVVGAYGIITFTYTANTAANNGANHEGDFNGLQLVEVTATPAPPSEPPIILSEPQYTNEELFAGRTAVFSCAAVGGNLHYQWETNGVPLVNGGNIAGATSPTLTIANVSAANVGSYSCMITNANTVGYQSTNTIPETLAIVAPNGTFETGLAADAPLHLYGFNDTGSPSPGPAQAYDNIAADNGTYGVNCENGSTPIFGPLPSDGFPGFSTTNYAVFMQYNDEPCNVQVSSPWLLDTNTVTITAWINPSYLPQVLGTVIVMNNAGNGDIEGIDFVTNGEGLAYDLGYIWNNDSGTANWDSGLTPPAGQWSFVALVVTPTSATISMMNANGITNATFVHNHANAAFAGKTIIGDNPGHLSGAYTFDGAIDEVAVFNRALTQNQVANLYADATQVAPTSQQAFIARPTLAGGNLTLSGSDGAAFGTYHVLTSTNLALPLQDWTVVANGTFSASGTFSVVLPVTNTASFFSIKSP